MYRYQPTDYCIITTLNEAFPDRHTLDTLLTVLPTKVNQARRFEKKGRDPGSRELPPRSIKHIMNCLGHVTESVLPCTG